MEYKRYVRRSNRYLGFPNSDDEDVFMIVFDVTFLDEEDLTIELIEKNKLKISLNHGFRDTGNICFLRVCVYVYSLPENIQTTNLVAYWSEDDFLIIKEKKTGETKEISNSREDPNEQEESNRTLNFSVTTKGNGKYVKLEIISPNEPSESEENIMQERKSTSSPNEIEEMVMMQETNGSSESKERIMQERKSLSAFCESEEKIMQERVSMSAPEQNEEKVAQRKRTTTASSESSENMEIDAKLMEASNILPTESRLIPIRVQNLFYRILCEGDVRAAINDIEKRIEFVNKFLEKHRDESLN